MGAVRGCPPCASSRTTAPRQRLIADSISPALPATNKQISGETVGTIHVVESMHERKAMMFDFADAFVTIPGGAPALRC